MSCIKREHIQFVIQVHGSVENLPGIADLKLANRDWAIPCLNAVAVNDKPQKMRLLAIMPALPEVASKPAKRATKKRKLEESSNVKKGTGKRPRR